VTAAAEEVTAGAEAEVAGLWNLSANCYGNCKCSGYQVEQYTTGAVVTGLVTVQGQLVMVKVVA